MVAQQTLTLFVWVQILVPLPKGPRLVAAEALFIEVWLSLVERYVRDVEVAGSNPVTSTMRSVLMGFEYPYRTLCFFMHFWPWSS